MNERLDKIVKRLDLITVILLVRSGLTRKEIAEALEVSEKTIERLISVSKIKGTKNKKIEPEPVQQIEPEVGKNEQGQ
ncbi:MAG: helix-turn-helix domain-containing protein [Candidatus Bathyarchaeia archaeon]